MHKPVDASATPPATQLRGCRCRASRYRSDLGARRPFLRAHAGRLGCDVIRSSRRQAPAKPTNSWQARRFSDFQNLHRNKRAITLNLKTDEAARS